MTAATATAVPTGNTFDKYGSTNPVVRRLMAGFEADARGAVRARRAQLGARRRLRRGRADARSGRGGSPPAGSSASTSRTRSCRPSGRARRRPNLEYRTMPAENLPFADGEFDLAARSRCSSTCPTPSSTVAEMARVARRHLLVSVPREPLWRALNVARGAYVRDLGNTPGHVNHWSRRAFVRAARAPRRGRRGAVAVSVDDAARAR